MLLLKTICIFLTVLAVSGLAMANALLTSTAPELSTPMAKILPNVYCQPLPYYIEETKVIVTDPLVYSLHRCMGKSERTKNKECVPKKVVNVTATVFYKGGIPYNLTRSNHTECHEVCKFNSSVCNEDQTWYEQSCLCVCNVKTPKQCEKPFRWEQVHCACRCPLITDKERRCDQGKIFSEEACGCICKQKALSRCTKKERYLDPTTCLCSDVPAVAAVGAAPCKDYGVISKAGLIIVTLIEAILIIGIIVAVKYFKKHPEKTCWDRKKQDNAFDSCSIETPTIEMNPSLSVNKVKKPKKKAKRSSKSDERPNIDIHKRPFLGIGGESKCRKYRYEMNNLVPVSSIKNDKLKLTDHVDSDHKNLNNYKNEGFDVSAQTIGSVTEI